MNILFTGIGRRIELVQAFRQAALNQDIELKIYGADMAGTAPALVFCDFTRIICGMREAQYIDELLNICKNDCIDIIIPTIDTDLMILSQNRDRFEQIGTRVLISRPEMIAICRDKNYTADFFISCGLKAPKTYNDYKKYPDIYPCFIKPKDGSSSINAFKVNDYEELVVYADKIEDYVIQPFISGKEYTVDIFCDFAGNPIYITPRERIAVRAGEVLKTQIFMDETLIEESKKIIEKFRPCGPMTVQVIRQTDTNEDYFIEINPRYGGGAPLSMKAGARSAEAVLRLSNGECLNYQIDAASDGTIYSRFDQSVCISSKSNQPLKGIIFDLDDTLYSEKEYVKSGFEKIGQFLNDEEAAEQLWKFFQDGRPAIDSYLNLVGRNDLKDKCLEIYRNQKPKIQLYPGVVELINSLISRGIKVGIITDGRVEGQKSKIEALGLDKIIEDIIITDELGGPQFRKPNDIAFRIMQCRWRLPYEQIAYVGDNIVKDFQAAKQLGMQGIYYQNQNGLYWSGNNCFDNYAISDLSELEDLGLCL